MTVSFNQAKFLERAIRSVVEQDYRDIEYIVVDPGSTDGSRDIIERHRGRIAKAILEPDRGAADGLNKGFAAATGEIFAYLNSDDAFLPGAMRAAAEAFERHLDADIIVGHGYLVDTDGKAIRRFRSAPFSPWRFAHGAAVVMQQSTFFRASAFKATAGFNIRNRTSWDYELYLDMCLAGARVRIVEGYWSLFTIHPDSISGSRRLDAEAARDQWRLFRRVMGRDRRPSDRVLSALARIWRWLIDPRGLTERLRDLLAPPALPQAEPPRRGCIPSPARCRLPPDATTPSLRRPVRLCIVVQYPIHNHLPLYHALAHDPDITLQVLFMQEAWSSSGHDPNFGLAIDWGLRMFEGYAWEVFRNVSPRRDGDGFWKYVNPKLIWRVLTGPWDAVCIHGHNNFTHVAAIAAARLGGKRVVIRTDTYNLGDRPLRVRLARALAYRVLYRLGHVLLYVGEHNRRCFEDFGGRPRQLVHAPQVVDNARFDAEHARLAPQRRALKAAFGIAADAKVVLYCGNFVTKKQPLMLVDAFLDAALGEDWTLLMVGDGALRGACEARAAERGAGATVVFAGFLDQNEVGRGYAVADVMVLPSAFQETWGLVVNEAMNFGCPVIVSDRVGCAPDLVAAKCGLVFPHDRRDALAAALRRMAQDDEFRIRCGKQARAVIAGWSVTEYMAGVHRALGLPGPPARILPAASP